MSPHRLLQGLDDPAGVGTFQRSDAHDLAGEVVVGHQDVNGPQAPSPDFRGIKGPDVIGIPGRDGAGLGLLFCLLRGSRGGGSVRGGPLQDVPHGRGREKDAQQFQLVGNADAAPTEVGLVDLPDEIGNVRWGLVRRCAGGFSLFDLVQPAIEGDRAMPKYWETFRVGI